MSDNSTNKPGFLPLVGGLLLFVWVAGAIPAVFYQEFQRKAQCIQTEGWLKGWLWCSTDERGFALSSIVRGSLWPIDAILWVTSDAQAASAVQAEPEQPAPSRAGVNRIIYSVEIAYSSLLGLNAEKEEVMDRGQLKDEQKCIAAVQDNNIQAVILAQTAHRGMKDALVRCLRTVSHDCDGTFLPACTSRQELGTPLRLHVFSDGGLLPGKVRQSMAGTTYTQTLTYSREQGQLQPFYLTQTKFDEAQAARLLGHRTDCATMLQSDEMLQARESLFSGHIVKAEIECYSFSEKGAEKRTANRTLLK